MRPDVSVAQLLRWRAERAAAEAPPAPPARLALALVRPWWETWPERFRAQVERLGHMQAMAYGRAMADPHLARNGHPVPALVVGDDGEVEATAHVLYLSVRDARLRLRFRLDGVAGPAEEAFEIDFVTDAAAPAASALATRSMDNEYRLDAAVTAELEREWSGVRVTDRMPFRLLLRPAARDG